MLVLYDEQYFKTGILIYYRVREEIFDIPRGYMKIHLIYRLVCGRTMQSPIDLFVTLKCIHFYILCIVPQCLFREASVM